MIAEHWCVHAENRVRGPQYIAEEQTFLNAPCPFHDELDSARRALGLDYVAFDYSLDRQGSLVIWEPNPFPALWVDFNNLDPYFGYQHAWMERVFMRVLGYYFERAEQSSGMRHLQLPALTHQGYASKSPAPHIRSPHTPPACETPRHEWRR